jgi:hypothetical protein
VTTRTRGEAAAAGTGRRPRWPSSKASSLSPAADGDGLGPGRSGGLGAGDEPRGGETGGRVRSAIVQAPLAYAQAPPGWGGAAVCPGCRAGNDERTRSGRHATGLLPLFFFRQSPRCACACLCCRSGLSVLPSPDGYGRERMGLRATVVLESTGNAWQKKKVGLVRFQRNCLRDWANCSFSSYKKLLQCDSSDGSSAGVALQNGAACRN